VFGDIEDAVARVLASAKDRSVVVIGVNVVRLCIDRGLYDEIVSQWRLRFPVRARTDPLEEPAHARVEVAIGGVP
jgi:hypothetical protein